MDENQIDSLLGLVNSIAMAEQANAGSAELTELLNQLHQASQDPLAASFIAQAQERQRQQAVAQIDAATPVELGAIKQEQEAALRELQNSYIRTGLKENQGPKQGYQYHEALGEYVHSTDGTVAPIRSHPSGSRVYNEQTAPQGAAGFKNPRMADGSRVTGSRMVDGVAQPFTYKTREQMSVEGNLQEQMKLILAMGSVEDSISAYAGLQTAMASQAQRVMQNLTSQAEHKLGVERLRNLLEQREVADRNRPDWWKTQTFSKETEIVRQQYTQAVGQAEALASKWAGSNPELISMQNQAKLFEWQLRRKEATAQWVEAKEFDRQKREEAKKDALRQQFKPEQIENFRIAYADSPEMADMSDEGIISILASGKKTLSKEEEAIFRMSHEEIQGLAIPGSNKLAERIYIQREARRTGNTPVDVQIQMKQLRNLATPDKVIRSMGWLDSSPEAKRLRNLEQMVNSGLAKPEEKAALQEQLFVAASGIMRQQNTARKLGDISSWVLPDGVIKDTADSLRASGQSKVSLRDTVQALVAKADKTQLADLSAQIKSAVQANLSMHKDDPLFGMDPMAAYSEVDRIFAQGIRSNALAIAGYAAPHAQMPVPPGTFANGMPESLSRALREQMQSRPSLF